MTIFLAGGSGAIGRSLVPMLVSAGYRVVAMTRSSERASALTSLGAEGVVGNVFDAAHLTALVTRARPAVVMHQLTAFGAGRADPLADTIRIRIEGTRNLIAAAQAAGASRLAVQSISFVCTPSGDGLTDEETPLYLDSPDGIRALVEAVSSLEQQTLHADGLEGVVLRYGWFYGPGTNYAPDGSIPRAIRQGRAPIVGGGAGTYSFIHVDDAASATMKALQVGARGIYNVVDDEPARLDTWLPVAAQLLGAPPPGRMSEDAARRSLGNLMVYVMDEQRGASNAKAKRELDWSPATPSWREGFRSFRSEKGEE